VSLATVKCHRPEVSKRVLPVYPLRFEMTASVAHHFRILYITLAEKHTILDLLQQ